VPFDRPSLTEIQARTEADLAARLGLSGLLPRSVLRALANAQAGLSHGEHGHLASLALEVVPTTASSEILDQWAGVWAVPRKPATFAAGLVTFTGSDGTTVPEGLQVRRSDGQVYTTTASGIIASGTADVPVQADLANALGNSAAALELVLVSSVSGLDATATVEAAGLNGGGDQEDDEALRARLLQRIQASFQGGSASNYVTWALEVPEVTRAWAIPNHNGAGTVGVTFVLDDHPSSIIPDASKVAEVDAYLEERRPVTAQVDTFAPGEKVLVPTIQIAPNTASVQAAVTASLEEMLKRTTSPGGTIYLSQISEAISNSDGESNHVLIAPVVDEVAAGNEIHTLGVVTFQSYP